VVAVHALSARNPHRRDGKCVEPGGKKANGAVVAEDLVHEGCLGSGGS
jgi:hypothetical protein